MTTHKTGAREEWLAARLRLLDVEMSWRPCVKRSPVISRII